MLHGVRGPTEEDLLDSVQALPKAAANVKSFFDLFNSGAQAYCSAFGVGTGEYTFVSVEDKSGKTVAGYVLFGKNGEKNEMGLLTLADFVQSIRKKEFDLHGAENPERFLSNFFAAASVAEKENITGEFKTDLAESLVSLTRPMHYFSGSKNEFAKTLSDLKSATYYVTPKPLWQQAIGLGEGRKISYAGQQAHDILKLSYSMLHPESRNFEGDLYDYVERELACGKDEEHKEFAKEWKKIEGMPLRTRILQALPRVAGAAMMLGAVGLGTIFEKSGAEKSGRSQQLPDIGISNVYVQKGGGNETVGQASTAEIVTQANTTDSLKVCYSETHSDPANQEGNYVFETIIMFDYITIFHESRNVAGIGNGITNTCKPIPNHLITGGGHTVTAIFAATLDGEKLQESDEQNNIGHATLLVPRNGQTEPPQQPAQTGNGHSLSLKVQNDSAFTPELFWLSSNAINYSRDFEICVNSGNGINFSSISYNLKDDAGNVQHSQRLAGMQREDIPLIGGGTYVRWAADNHSALLNDVGSREGVLEPGDCFVLLGKKSGGRIDSPNWTFQLSTSSATNPAQQIPAETLQRIKQYMPAILHDSRPDTEAVRLYTPYNPHADDSDIKNNHENFDAGKFPKDIAVYAQIKETRDFDFYEYVFERASNPHWAGLAPDFFSHEHDTNYAIVKVDKRTGRPVAIAGSFHELGWAVRQISDVSELELYSEWGSHEFLTGLSPTADGRGPAITKNSVKFVPLEDRIRSADIDSSGYLLTNEPHKSIKGVRAPWLREELSDPERLVFQKYSTEGWQKSAMWFELHSPADIAVELDGKVTDETKTEIPNSAYHDKAIGIMAVNPNAQPKIIVKGTGNGTIHLSGYSLNGKTNMPHFRMEAPITNGQVYQVVPDWQAIAQNKTASVKISIDQDGDGVFEKTIQQDSTITPDEISGTQSSSWLKNNWLLPAAVVAGIAGIAGFFGLRRRPEGSGDAAEDLETIAERGQQHMPRDEETPEYWYQSANKHRAADRLIEAKAAIDKAIDLDASNPAYFDLAAQICEGLGKPKKARLARECAEELRKTGENVPEGKPEKETAEIEREDF